MNNVFGKTDIEEEIPRLNDEIWLNLNLNLIIKQHFYIYNEYNKKKSKTIIIMMMNSDWYNFINKSNLIVYHI